MEASAVFAPNFPSLKSELHLHRIYSYRPLYRWASSTPLKRWYGRRRWSALSYFLHTPCFIFTNFYCSMCSTNFTAEEAILGPSSLHTTLKTPVVNAYIQFFFSIFDFDFVGFCSTWSKANCRLPSPSSSRFQRVISSVSFVLQKYNHLARFSTYGSYLLPKSESYLYCTNNWTHALGFDSIHPI